MICILEIKLILNHIAKMYMYDIQPYSFWPQILPTAMLTVLNVAILQFYPYWYFIKMLYLSEITSISPTLEILNLVKLCITDLGTLYYDIS